MALKYLAASVTLGTFFIAGQAVATGLEGVTPWNAKHAALGGNATSFVHDSSAMLFNPAGLGFAEKNDIAVHVALFKTDKKVPVNEPYSTFHNSAEYPYRGGLTANYILGDQLTLGVLIGNVGGTQSHYKNITAGVGPGALKEDYESYTNIMEAAVGLGYRINNNFSFGASWRYTRGEGKLQSVVPFSLNSNVGAVSNYKDLSGTDSGGYRLGIQYRSDDGLWNAGLNYRSSVKMKLEGKHNQTVVGVPALTYTDKDASVELTFPEQITLGASRVFTDDLTLYGQYTFTKYSKLKELVFEREDTPVATQTIPLDWNDRHSYKLGAAYTGYAWPLRVGYNYTTQTIPDKTASPTFQLPSKAHAFSIGTGRSFLDDKLMFDFMFGYAEVVNKDLSESSATNGEYSEKVLWTMGSLKYHF